MENESLQRNPTINATPCENTAQLVTEGDVLDDKLLEVVTPRLTILDDSHERDLHSAFCTRCRTISSSFLSSPNYRSSANEYVDSNAESGSHQPRFYSARRVYTEDDEPLLRDEESGTETSTYPSTAEHCHTPKPSDRNSRRAITKLLLASMLTTVFMIGEAVGGWLASSIAIMSDAAHLMSDLTSFIVSLAAIYLAMRPASKKMSFGYHRAEVLGAVVSVLIIWVITGILVYAAAERVITMDFEIDADTMIIVSGVGVAINIVLGIVLHAGSGQHGHSHGPRLTSATSSAPQEHHGNNINIRAAFIHVVGDLIQSIGVLIAAYIVKYYPKYKIADPICTFLFSVMVLITTVPIVKDLGHVLMEGTPSGLDLDAINANLSSLPGVKLVHSLHVWSLTLDKNACAVHLAISPESDPEEVLKDAQRLIRSRHHIYQTTIQVERYQPLLMDNCQQCQPLAT